MLTEETTDQNLEPPQPTTRSMNPFLLNPTKMVLGEDVFSEVGYETKLPGLKSICGMPLYTLSKIEETNRSTL